MSDHRWPPPCATCSRLPPRLGLAHGCYRRFPVVRLVTTSAHLDLVFRLRHRLTASDDCSAPFVDRRSDSGERQVTGMRSSRKGHPGQNGPVAIWLLATTPKSVARSASGRSDRVRTPVLPLYSRHPWASAPARASASTKSPRRSAKAG